MPAADGQIKSDMSAGRPGVEVKIADNGEVLVRADAAQEYYKRPRRHRRIDQRRRLFPHRRRRLFDADGHLEDHRPRQDVGKGSNGAMFAPNYIENKLKFFRTSRRRCASATDRDHGLRLHQHRHDGAVGNWAERRGIAYSGYTDLAGKPRSG